MNSRIKVTTITPDIPASTVSRSQLREIREQKGLSRRQVAEQLGVTIAAIQDYERSEAAGKITLKTLRKYAEVLGCEVTITITPNGTDVAYPSPTKGAAPRRRSHAPSPAPPEPAPTATLPDLQDRMGLWSAR